MYTRKHAVEFTLVNGRRLTLDRHEVREVWEDEVHPCAIATGLHRHNLKETYDEVLAKIFIDEPKPEAEDGEED